jgi:hypothetical protein
MTDHQVHADAQARAAKSHAAHRQAIEEVAQRNAAATKIAKQKRRAYYAADLKRRQALNPDFY